MKRLILEKYKALQKADFYTLRFSDKEICETDDFIQRFVHDLLYQKDFSTIVYWLNKMGQESGTLERFFRPEKGAKAIPIYSSRLRLYCIRISDDLLILGNGGVKSSQKVQDSPDAYPSFLNIITIQREFAKRRNRNEITISGREIEGNLNFDLQ